MPYITLSDEELCLNAQSGDADSEQQLAERYVSLVRACARPLFLQGGDSEDLIQEGMIGLINAIREYSPDKYAKFRTFSERCIKNRLISAVRTASRIKHKPLTDYVDVEDEAVVNINSNPLNPEDLYLKREADSELNNNLQKLLSSLEAQILTYYLEGLSYSDISKVTGKSTKSIDNAVQRIRRKLIVMLDN